MIRLIIAVLAAVITLPAHATLLSWISFLDVAQAGLLPTGTSNPATASGSGTAFGTYDTDSNVLTYTVEVSGLSGNATLAHFHFGAPGVYRGPIRVERPTLSLDTLAGAKSGMFSGSEDLDLITDPPLPAGGVDQLESELLAGLWYINIHTTAFPAGEIRGQVTVPEPAGLALVGLGLILAAFIRRRDGLLEPCVPNCRSHFETGSNVAT